MKKLTLLIAFLMLLTTAAVADIRLPDTPKPTPSPKTSAKAMNRDLTIRLSPNVEEATLEIPKDAIKSLRAALENVDDNGAIAGTTGRGFNITPTQTLMSGLFLSLALTVGGVWFFKSKPIGNAPKVAAGLIAAMVFGGCATLIFANAAPPPIKGINADLFSDQLRRSWRGANGSIKIVVVEQTYENAPIVLNIPRGDKKVAGEE